MADSTNPPEPRYHAAYIPGGGNDPVIVAHCGSYSQAMRVLATRAMGVGRDNLTLDMPAVLAANLEWGEHARAILDAYEELNPQTPIDGAQVEAVAKAIYEHSRDPDYYEAEYDWPNIDTGYDKDDEDETDPEWLRNRFRAEARVAIAALRPVDAPSGLGYETADMPHQDASKNEADSR